MPEQTTSSMMQRLALYAQLVRLDRPVGILLLLWPTLWALWFAAQPSIPAISLIVIFTLGAVLMRSAGCAINDYADRKLDGQVERTKNRPLASGQIAPMEALLIFIAIALFACGLIFFLNVKTRWLAVIGVLLAASYPFAKRFHHLPQIHLGIAFAWSVPMAYTAQTGEWPDEAGWILFTATVIWTTAYDTMYAIADRKDDILAGNKSTAILFGEFDKVIIGILQIATISCLVMLGVKSNIGWPYYLSLLAACALCVYQQYLLKERIPSQCIQAFKNNQYIGLVILIGIICSNLSAISTFASNLLK